MRRGQSVDSTNSVRRKRCTRPATRKNAGEVFSDGFVQIKVALQDRLVQKPDTDHFVWKGNSKALIIKNVCNSVQVWFYIVQEQSTVEADDPNIIFRKKCVEPDCIAHYKPHQIGLTSVREMNEWDYEAACDLITRNSVVDEHTGCRNWTGFINHCGYGKTAYFGQCIGAHKLAFILATCDDVPVGMDIRHKCGSGKRSCVEESHLELGTKKQNAADKVRDGTAAIGEKSPCAVIDEKQAKDVVDRARRLLKIHNRNHTTHLIADEMKMLSFVIVKNIVFKAAWKHLWTPEEMAEKKANKRKRTALDAQSVLQMKKDRENGMSRSQRATKYDISERTVSCIDRGYTWSHIDPKMSANDVAKMEQDVYYAQVKERLNARIEKVIDVSDGKEHWIWQGCEVLGFRQRTRSVYRVSWIVYNNEYDNDAEVTRHLCVVKRCVHFQHLQPGTNAENAQDRIRDDTQLRGALSPSATISEETARLIKDSRGQGTQAERADRFHTTRNIVSCIDEGLTWKHVGSKVEDGDDADDYVRPAKRQRVDNKDASVPASASASLKQEEKDAAATSHLV